MKTILVPTDFSKCADNALAYALEIAWRTQSTVHLLHIMSPTEGINNTVYEIFWMDDHIQAKRAALEQLVRRMRKNENFKTVPVRTEVRLGYPVTEIADYAEAIQAELIVMGTTGTTGLKQIFLGSTTAAVFGKVKTPVLAVPPKSSYRTGGRFAFATDFQMQLAPTSLEVLKKVLGAHFSNLTVVHIAKKQQEEHDRGQEALFSRKIGELRPEFHYLEGNNVAQEIGNFMEATKASGLVAVSHDHGLIHRLISDSVTRQLAHRIHVPMLVLHDASTSEARG